MSWRPSDLFAWAFLPFFCSSRSSKNEMTMTCNSRSFEMRSVIVFICLSMIFDNDLAGDGFEEDMGPGATANDLPRSERPCEWAVALATEMATDMRSHNW